MNGLKDPVEYEGFQFLIKGYTQYYEYNLRRELSFQFLIKGYQVPHCLHLCHEPSFNSSLKDTVDRGEGKECILELSIPH